MARWYVGVDVQGEELEVGCYRTHRGRGGKSRDWRVGWVEGGGEV